jgi:hypothetical protein
MNGYEKLAADIVKAAVHDYRKASMNLNVLKEKGVILRLTNRVKYERLRKKYVFELDAIEQFIQSQYFGVLTSMNPGLLLKTLREEGYNNGCKKVPKSG